MLAYTDITCVHESSSLEPNDLFAQARYLGGGFGNTIDALVGAGDVDWYMVPTTCDATNCEVVMDLIGRGVKFDLYRNDELVKEGATEVGYLDPYTGTHPIYRIRVDASSRLAYRFQWTF